MVVVSGRGASIQPAPAAPPRAVGSTPINFQDVRSRSGSHVLFFYHLSGATKVNVVIQTHL